MSPSERVASEGIWQLTKKWVIVPSVALIAAGYASAQSGGLVTGAVVDAYMSGSNYVIELDVPSPCGSSTYVSSLSPNVISSAQEAVAIAQSTGYGTVTLRLSGCSGQSAVFSGAAGSAQPDE